MATSDTVYVPKMVAGNFSPPSSYTTGGVLLDLSADFSFLNALKLDVETLGVLMPVIQVHTYNSDLAGAFAQGKAVIKFMRCRYDKTTVGAVASLPGGVTAQSAKFAAGTTTGSSHTHSIDHDHPSTTSGVVIPQGGAGNNPDAAVGGPDLVGHTHTVDIAAFTGTSGAATHTHDRSFEYDHDHSITTTETAGVLTEVANGTDLSATVFRYLAYGQG